MALKPCKECGAPVSDKAESCPMCGVIQSKQTSLITWICVGILGLAAVIWMFTDSSNGVSSHKESKQLTAEDIITAKQMQAYAQIKGSLKDPDSATINFYKGKPCGQYKAKNSFGAYTGYKRIVLLKDINIEGKIDKVQFEKMWNKHCEGVNF